MNIEVPKDRIAEFCQKWKIVELSFFGSVLRDDFRPDSDVDVLVTFAPDGRYSLFDLVHMEQEHERHFLNQFKFLSVRSFDKLRTGSEPVEGLLEDFQQAATGHIGREFRGCIYVEREISLRQ